MRETDGPLSSNFTKSYVKSNVHIDNQGDRNICVRSSISKAITNGLYFGKWTKGSFPVDQQFVLGTLLGDRFDTLDECVPVNLKGRVLRLQNYTTKRWLEFYLEVIMMSKKQLLKGTNENQNEYLVFNL